MPQSPLHARVYGAGPTGALAALALAASGWRVQLIDPLTPQQLRNRSRAYALTHSSRTLLDGLGLWQPLLAELAPFRRLELCDLATHQRVSFSLADLGDRGPEPSSQAVGWILQHGPLMELLLERLALQPSITTQLGALPAGAELPPVDLVVAADGRSSPTRRGAGLHWLSRPYRQGCLTVQVRLRGSDPDQAWELFRPEGPFAVLPLGEDAYQLVWSAPLERLKRLEALEPVAFLEALTAALPEPLQPEVLLDQPQAFPLGLELAWPLQRRGLVLVGEAAHRCHPVGGQGLNLCWRDVAVLQALAARVASGRLRRQRLAAAYGWRRWPDLLLVLLSTHALVVLFSNRQPLLLPLRRLALALLAQLPALRRLSLAAMTDGLA
jgi:2-octaprenyl-6-methoxyphenol hydroxylase